jgi:hypothetical protein
MNDINDINNLNDYELILINPECTRTEFYIIDCDIQIHSNSIIKHKDSINIPIVRLFTR